MPPRDQDLDLNDTSRCGASQYVVDCAIPNWKKLKTGIKGCVKQTTAVMHVYANSATGNDNNAGTQAKPVKTLQAAFDLVPTYVRHNVAIHLRGTFVVVPNPDWNFNWGASCIKLFDKQPFLVIDGGSDVVVEAGPFTADPVNTPDGSWIKKTGAGWTEDQFFGRLIQITGPAGNPCKGQTRMIKSNTADTIIPTFHWSQDPGNCQFKIVHPKTEINMSGYGTDVIFGSSGGNFRIQRITFTGDAPTPYDTAGALWGFCEAGGGQALMQFTQVVLANPGSFFSAFFICSTGLIGSDGDLVDPDTFVDDLSYSTTSPWAGMGVTTPEQFFVSLFGTDNAYFADCALAALLSAAFVGSFSIGNGTRVQLLKLSSSQGFVGHPITFNYGPDWAVTEVRPLPTSSFNFTPAVTLFNSYAEIGELVVNTLDDYGMELIHSSVFLRGTAGTSGLFGVYAHANSTVLVDGYVPPTISGPTPGDTDLTTDGIAQLAAWGDIGPAPVIDRGVAGDWTTLAQTAPDWM